MVQVPVRWNTASPLPASNHNTRRLVANATAGALDFDPSSFEILSLISGRRLTSAQRAALLPSLCEHLAGPPAPPINFGPLADTDVLAAVMGLAHFAAEEPADWVFVRIPEAQHSTPDIWAAHGQSAPWNIELKGSAPLSGDLALGEVLDTCGGRVFPQVSRGREQLAHPVGPSPQGTPSIRVRSIPGFGGPTSGGLALAVSILPDVGLLGRSDVGAAAKGGCPKVNRQHLACRVRCFPDQSPSTTSATTVLWTQRTPPSTPTLPPEAQPAASHGLLPVVHAAVLAAWSDNQKAAAIALARLVDRVLEIDHEHTRAIALLLLGVLVETRSTMRADQRVEAVDRFIRTVGPRENESWPEEIEREARAGLAEERASVPIEQLDVDRQPVDVELTLDSGVWRGRWTRGELRLSAPLEVLEPVLDGRRLRGLAEREVVPALKRILSGRLPPVDAIGDGTQVAVTRRPLQSKNADRPRGPAVTGTVWWPYWLGNRPGDPADPLELTKMLIWLARRFPPGVRPHPRWPWWYAVRASNDGRIQLGW